MYLLRDANLKGCDIFIIVTFAKFCNHLELFTGQNGGEVAYAHLYDKLTQ